MTLIHPFHAPWELRENETSFPEMSTRHGWYLHLRAHVMSCQLCCCTLTDFFPMAGHPAATFLLLEPHEPSQLDQETHSLCEILWDSVTRLFPSSPTPGSVSCPDCAFTDHGIQPQCGGPSKEQTLASLHGEDKWAREAPWTVRTWQ